MITLYFYCRLFGNGSLELKSEDNSTTFQPPNTFTVGFENVSENGQDFIDEIFLVCDQSTDEVQIILFETHY